MYILKMVRVCRDSVCVYMLVYVTGLDNTIESVNNGTLKCLISNTILRTFSDTLNESNLCLYNVNQRFEYACVSLYTCWSVALIFK